MLLRLLADGGGSSGRGQPAASPPFPAPPQTWRMAAGFGLQANGADSSAPSRIAATPPRPRSTAASLPSHLFFFCSSTTASGSHWRSPLLPAARSPQHRDPPQQRGLSDSVSLLHPFHYQLLHRPRSVPTALGPAPLATVHIVSLLCSTLIWLLCLSVSAALLSNYAGGKRH